MILFHKCQTLIKTFQITVQKDAVEMHCFNVN